MKKRLVIESTRIFLRKNKDIIISQKDLNRFGESKIARLFELNKKHIFIIDKSEIKNDEILIKKVKFLYTPYE